MKNDRLRARAGITAGNGEEPLVRIPQGLIGFERYRRFVWDSPAEPRLARFRVLRSVEDANLVFLVLPLSDAPDAIGHSDLELACAEHGAVSAECDWFLVVTPRLAGDEIRVTANLRAPLVLERERGIGRQVVLANERLSIRYPI